MLIHDARSSIMNSSTFSWGLIVPVQYSGVVVMVNLFTWKPLKMTRPHCSATGAATGVLKLNSWANCCWMQLPLE